MAHSNGTLRPYLEYRALAQHTWIDSLPIIVSRLFPVVFQRQFPVSSSGSTFTQIFRPGD